MNKLQKKLVVFLFILSLGILVSAFKAGKAAVEKNNKIEGLLQKTEELTKKGQELGAGLEEREKELSQAKLDIENLGYKLAEEKKRSESFQIKYNDEKERGDSLGADLNRLKLTLEEEKKASAASASDIEKLKEENKLLSRDLKEVRLAKQALEEYVGEKKEGTGTEPLQAPVVGDAKIITVYPQGLLAIEMEESHSDMFRLGKIIDGQREIKISRVHGYMFILEVAGEESLTGLKKGDVIKYVR